MAASKEQQKLMKEWQNQTGWEFMNIHAVDSKDKQGFIELWNRNVTWLQHNTLVASGLADEYQKKHGV